MSAFTEDARRFLSPLSKLRTETVKNAVDSLWTLSFSYANVFFVNEIMKSIVAGDEAGLKIHTAAFAAFVPVFWTVRTGLRRWGYVEFRHRVMGRLFSEYSKKFLLFSNEDFERFGTSKVSHTLDKGVTSWSKLLHEFVRGVATIAVTFAVMSYLVISASPILYFAFLALLAVSLVLNRSISKRTREAKLVRAEVIRETNRHIVRMAMSKFEILLSDRSSGESAKFAPLMNRLEVSAEPSERWSRLSFSVLSFSLDALRITLYLAVGLQIFRGENSIAFLVSTIAFLGIIERNLLTLSSLLDQFQQEFVFVRELWTMSDRTPAMAGYESGIPFISGDGAFDLRNVSFRYSEDSPYVLENLNLEVS